MTTLTSTFTNTGGAAGAWQAVVDRLRRWSLATVLHATTGVVAAVLTGAALVATADRLYSFADVHQPSTATAVSFPAMLLGLWTLLTCYGWRARLRGHRMPRTLWLMLWLVVAATAAATATGDQLATQAVGAAPVAVLAALSVVLTRTRP